jgi:hypothetical protein
MARITCYGSSLLALLTRLCNVHGSKASHGYSEWSMSNSLSRRIALGLFPLLLGVLLRHYYTKLVRDKNKGKGKACVAVPLRSEELMYDEAFSIMRVSHPLFPILSDLLITMFQDFMNISTRYTLLITPCQFLTVLVLDSHSVEEMQKLSHIHTPIPPSAHVTRLSVPLSCCEDAARVLIELFGGEREATRILGGVRWWQVRAGADQGCVFVFILWTFDG